MKNFFIAAGLTAFAIGACNTASKDGMAKSDDMNQRDQTSTSTADRGTMPSGTTSPSTSATRPQSSTTPATPSADGSSTMDTDMRDGTMAPGERDRTEMGTAGTTPQGMAMDMPATDRDDMSTDMQKSDMSMDKSDMNMDHSGMDMKSDMSMGSNTAASSDMTNPKTVVDAVGQYGGLTSLPKDVAMKVVDGYITKLSGMPGTSALVTDLNIVKMQLGSSSIDNKKMGAALQRLGSKTVSMADGDSAYEMLGQALVSSGAKLVGM